MKYSKLVLSLNTRKCTLDYIPYSLPWNLSLKAQSIVKSSKPFKIHYFFLISNKCFLFYLFLFFNFQILYYKILHAKNKQNMVPFANKENGNENNSLKIFLFIPFSIMVPTSPFTHLIILREIEKNINIFLLTQQTKKTEVF